MMPNDSTASFFSDNGDAADVYSDAQTNRMYRSKLSWEVIRGIYKGFDIAEKRHGDSWPQNTVDTHTDEEEVKKGRWMTDIADTIDPASASSRMTNDEDFVFRLFTLHDFHPDSPDIRRVKAKKAVSALYEIRNKGTEAILATMSQVEKTGKGKIFGSPKGSEKIKGSREKTSRHHYS